jgi:hypothetical protein
LRAGRAAVRSSPMVSIGIILVFLLAFVALNFYEFGRGD